MARMAWNVLRFAKCSQVRNCRQTTDPMEKGGGVFRRQLRIFVAKVGPFEKSRFTSVKRHVGGTGVKTVERTCVPVHGSYGLERYTLSLQGSQVRGCRRKADPLAEMGLCGSLGRTDPSGLIST